MGIEDKLSMSG